MPNPASFPLPQTSYTQFPQPGYSGMLADLGNRDVVSLLADAALDAGMGVCFGAAAGECTLPSQASDVTANFLGISVLLVMKEPNTTAFRYAAKDTVPVLKKGRIWVMPQGDLVDQGQLFCIRVAGATAGMFRGDNTNASLVPNAIVLQGATVASGKPALVEINLV